MKIRSQRPVPPNDHVTCQWWRHGCGKTSINTHRCSHKVTQFLKYLFLATSTYNSPTQGSFQIDFIQSTLQFWQVYFDGCGLCKSKNGSSIIIFWHFLWAKIKLLLQKNVPKGYLFAASHFWFLWLLSACKNTNQPSNPTWQFTYEQLP